MPVVVGVVALRRPGRQRPRPGHRAPTPTGWAQGGVLREVVHNSQALLAFFALSNADVIVARNVLDEHDAGLYAGGLILTKAVLFLPQFVVVSRSRRWRRPSAAGPLTRSLSLVAVLGVGW